MQTLALGQGLHTQGFKHGIDDSRLDGIIAAECRQFFYLFALGAHEVISLLGGKAQTVTFLGQTHIGIILTQQDAVLGARGKHAVRLIHATGHQVIDEDTDIGLVATQGERLTSRNPLVGIDTGNQPLPCRFLIARRAVDLSCKVQVLHQFGLQRVIELRRVKEIIFDGIAWTESMYVTQCGNVAQCFELHFPGQRRRETVEVHLVGLCPLGLDKQLVGRLVGKGDDLGLNAGAITWADAGDLTVIKRRLRQPFTQHVMHLLVGMHDPAGTLRQGRSDAGQIGKMVEILLPVLTDAL